MSRRINGSALTQYAIVIALVAVVAASGYLIFGQTIVSCLTDYSNALNNNNAVIAENVSSSSSSSSSSSGAGSSGSTTTPIVPPGDPLILDPAALGGSSGDPQISCTAGMCSIDYGTYIFNGIPEDFSGFVETSGTTAGTDVVLTVLDALIEAAEAGNIEMSSDDLAKVRIVAQKGHALASGEKSLENFIANEDISTLVSSGISSTGERSYVDMEAEVLALCEGEEFTSALNTFKSYDETEMDPVIQNMVAILGDHIQTLYNDFDSRTSLMYWNSAVDEETTQAAYEEFFASHHVSGLTDLNSTIICGIGNGVDTGIVCNP